MNRIVASVTTLEQHIEAVQLTPSIYRPPCCPYCGIKIVWHHGSYRRKADRPPEGEGSRNPVPILRFCCSGCRRTCSRLPQCIAPRRWYDWSVQQNVLERLLNGCSLTHCARLCVPDRRTVNRWWQWLQERGPTFGFHLRARLPELGRSTGFVAFWRQVFDVMGLPVVMALLDQEIIVP